MITRPIVVRTEPGTDRPFVAGHYTREHRWSPLLAFTTAPEAVMYAAGVNRRMGRWA